MTGEQCPGLGLWGGAFAAFVLAPLIVRAITGWALPFELYVRDCHWRWLPEVCLKARCPPLTPLGLCGQFASPQLSWVPVAFAAGVTGVLITWPLLGRRSFTVTVVAAALLSALAPFGGGVMTLGAYFIVFALYALRPRLRGCDWGTGVVLGLAAFGLALQQPYLLGTRPNFGVEAVIALELLPCAAWLAFRVAVCLRRLLSGIRWR